MCRSTRNNRSTPPCQISAQPTWLSRRLTHTPTRSAILDFPTRVLKTLCWKNVSRSRWRARRKNSNIYHGGEQQATPCPCRVTDSPASWRVIQPQKVRRGQGLSRLSCVSQTLSAPKYFFQTPCSIGGFCAGRLHQERVGFFPTVSFPPISQNLDMTAEGEKREGGNRRTEPQWVCVCSVNHTVCTAVRFVAWLCWALIAARGEVYTCADTCKHTRRCSARGLCPANSPHPKGRTVPREQGSRPEAVFLRWAWTKPHLFIGVCDTVQIHTATTWANGRQQLPK